MSEQSIDTVTRRAAEAVSRRTSLLALGGVALATLTAVPSAAKGGKGGKGGKNGNGRKDRKKGTGGAGNAGEQLAQARCASQGDQCRASLTQLCAGEPVCLEGLACCDLFATCNAAAGLNCIVA